MASIYTLLGALALPAVGVKLSKEYIEPKSDDLNTVATKVFAVYGGLAAAAFGVYALTGNKAIGEFAKGGMYATATVGGLALGDRIFFADEQAKITPAAVNARLPAAAVQGARVQGAPAYTPGGYAPRYGRGGR